MAKRVHGKQEASRTRTPSKTKGGKWGEEGRKEIVEKWREPVRGSAKEIRGEKCKGERRGKNRRKTVNTQGRPPAEESPGEKIEEGEIEGCNRNNGGEGKGRWITRMGGWNTKAQLEGVSFLHNTRTETEGKCILATDTERGREYSKRRFTGAAARWAGGEGR